MPRGGFFARGPSALRVIRSTSLVNSTPKVILYVGVIRKYGYFVRRRENRDLGPRYKLRKRRGFSAEHRAVMGPSPTALAALLRRPSCRPRAGVAGPPRPPRCPRCRRRHWRTSRCHLLLRSVSISVFAPCLLRVCHLLHAGVLLVIWRGASLCGHDGVMR